MMDRAIPASPQNSSSNTVRMPSPSVRGLVANNSMEYRPTLAASWIIGHGVSSRSSHSAAAGRITSAGTVNPIPHLDNVLTEFH